jgi:hypothetical protein
MFLRAALEEVACHPDDADVVRQTYSRPDRLPPVGRQLPLAGLTSVWHWPNVPCGDAYQLGIAGTGCGEPPFRAGYLLTSVTARARPGSVEASRRWLANRLPTGVMGVAR